MARLERADLDADPLEQFRRWLDEARRVAVRQPTAAALATVSGDGQPSARMVLLKSADRRGLVFATRYDSRKARELDVNPRACLLFHWDELERQVRVEGRVRRAIAEESDAIFRDRPRGARLGAWASPQSRPLRDRRELEHLLAEARARFAGEIPRPDCWGALRLEPTALEFWQGRPFRLHDRFRWTRDPDGAWRVERLAP